MACKRSPWRTSRRPTRTAGFPVIFVDEGQDTDPAFVDALREVAQAVSLGFCLGFFGDPLLCGFTIFALERYGLLAQTHHLLALGFGFLGRA